VRGGVRERLRGVRAVRAGALQGRAGQRDVRGVPGAYEHDDGGARGAGAVPVRAGLLLERVCVPAVRRRLLQGPREQRGVRAVPRRHVLSGAVCGARAVRGEQLAAAGWRTDSAGLPVPAGIFH